MNPILCLSLVVILTTAYGWANFFVSFWNVCSRVPFVKLGESLPARTHESCLGSPGPPMPGLSFMPTASCWAFVDPYALGCLVGQKPDGHQPLLWEAQQEVALELGFFNFALERGPPLAHPSGDSPIVKNWPDTFPHGGTMGIKLIIAAYFALVATMFVAGVVMLSVHDLQELRLNALDNPYLVRR